jgi:large subunit ribosomal protein L32e
MSPEGTPEPPAAEGAAPAPVKAARRRTPAKPRPVEAPKDEERAEAPEGPRAPRRAELAPAEVRLLSVRSARRRRRPKFVRQQSHRYLRIRRRGSWRAPRGVQSKQRRHYGFRPTVVSVGFGTPRAVRGLTPGGFRPVRVENARAVEGLNPKREAAVIAHGVGVRKRLVLEEMARRRGLKVLNPIFKEDRPEEGT